MPQSNILMFVGASFLKGEIYLSIKKKILYISMFFLAFICITCKCFGFSGSDESFDVEIDNKTIDKKVTFTFPTTVLDDDGNKLFDVKYYLIHYSSSVPFNPINRLGNYDCYNVILSDVPIIVSDDYKFIYLSDTSKSSSCYILYSDVLTDSYYSEKCDVSSSSENFTKRLNQWYITDDRGINSSSFNQNFFTADVFANQTIKNKSGDVVFMGAPQTVEQVKIPAIQQAEEIPQAMAEVLKILIPVGLVIFGIGLVIYLIRYCRSRLM